MLRFSAGQRHLPAVWLGLASLGLRPVMVHGQVAPAPLSSTLRQPSPPADTLHTDLREVVVTASRVEESFLQSPVTVEKLNARAIRLSPAPSFFDAIDNLKGVQVITPSIGFKVINARGFTNTTNVRFAQLVDGVDNQAPHIGGPIGNVLGPSDLDIQNVELVPGTAAALYGLNAINGLANFQTRNPFSSQGLSVRQQTTSMTRMSRRLAKMARQLKATPKPACATRRCWWPISWLSK
jgi:outer membrane receptor protein involved in Fe transport